MKCFITPFLLFPFSSCSFFALFLPFCKISFITLYRFQVVSFSPQQLYVYLFLLPSLLSLVSQLQKLLIQFLLLPWAPVHQACAFYNVPVLELFVIFPHSSHSMMHHCINDLPISMPLFHFFIILWQKSNFVKFHLQLISTSTLLMGLNKKLNYSYYTVFKFKTMHFK